MDKNKLWNIKNSYSNALFEIYKEPLATGKIKENSALHKQIQSQC